MLWCGSAATPGLMSGYSGLPVRSAPPPPPPKKKQPPPRPPPPRARRATPPLIDLASPPSSPARDGLSVDSFGSSTESRSRVESGFEDDFSDGRADSPADPFSPARRPPPACRAVFDAAEFPDPLCNGAPVGCRPQLRTEPTVIRAKPRSPPMPAGPPPPPPPHLDLDAMRLDEVERYVREDPYAVALFDFPGSHPDDLPFSAGDKIRLVRRINDEWLFGKLRSGVEGTFPASYARVEVPLPPQPQPWATALYDFAAQQQGDLALRAGLRVRLLRRVDRDWLCGEAEGRRGQFPAAYVDSVPADL